MSNLVTIWTFPYQHQLLIIRGRLESEGIETFTQDELTIQVDPLYSNAIGGIKLMVREQDVARAIKILAELGFVKEREKPPFDFLQVLSDYTSRLPLVGKWKIESRVFILVALFILFTAGVLYFFVAR